MTKLLRRFVATVIFSGEFGPNPVLAEAGLRASGFEVVRMPEKFRPLLAHPRDYFFEVFKKYRVASGADEMGIADRMLDHVEEIVARYGAMADDCGFADDDHEPFRWMVSYTLEEMRARLPSLFPKA